MLINSNFTQNYDIYKGKKIEINSLILGIEKTPSDKKMQEFQSFMYQNALKDPNKIEKSPLKDFGEYSKYNHIAEIMKLNNFVSYANIYKLSPEISLKAADFRQEFGELLKADLNIKEFKEKYLDFKQRHDEFVKEFEAAMGDNLLVKDISKEFENFKAIKGESKNKETYKDEIKQNFFLTFLEAQKEKGVNILEILENLHKNNTKVDIKI